MNTNHDPELERAISRELKSLPELTAPAAIANRVMTTIERRSAVPWYRRSWGTWPAVWQAAALATMLILFGGLCLGGWEVSRLELVARGMSRAVQWLSELKSFANTFHILADSVMVVARHLGRTFIIASLVAAGLAYALFLGLGTVCYRLALTKPQPFKI
jgi:hypothetical protein